MADAVEVGMWIAFPRPDLGHDRLVGQVVAIVGSGRPADPAEIRVWCSQIGDVLPVQPSAVLDVVQWTPPPLRRRMAADGS